MAFQDLIDTAGQIYNIFTQPRETPAPIQEGPTALQTSTVSTQVQQPTQIQQPAAPISVAGPAVPGMFPGLGGPQRLTAPMSAVEQQQAEQFRQRDMGMVPPVPGGVQVGQLPQAQQQAISPQQVQQQAQQQAQQPPMQFDQNNVYDRILGMETGGRHRDAQGNIMRSSKGALGIAQIMPSTAAKPGYGLRPLVGEEIYDEAKNREFGRNYFGAMVKQFGGDVEKGVAAYNAGEGGVKRAIASATQAGNPNAWRNFLPAETQTYLKNVIGPMVAEQQQAKTQPTAAQPTAPAPALPGIPNPVQMKEFDQVMNSGDTNQMIAYLNKAPDWQRKLLEYQIADTFDLNRKKAQAQTQVQEALVSKDPRSLERNLKDKELGPLILGFLATALSPELGRQIASEGGWFNTYGTTELDGQTVSYRAAPDGRLLQAVYTTGDRQGQDVSQNDLRRLYGQVSSTKGVSQGKTLYGDITEKITKDKFILETYEGQNKAPRFRRVGGGPDASEVERQALTQLGVAGTLDTQAATQRQKANIELEQDWAKAKIAISKAGPQAAAEEAARFNFKHGTNFTPQQFSGVAPQIDITTGRMIVSRPEQQAAATTTGAAPAQAKQPTTAPSATTTGQAPTAGRTPADIEVAKEATTAQKVEEGKTVGKNIGELKNKQVQLETDIEQMITSVDGALQSPGMKSAVGLKGPERLFGLKAKPFEGTPAADFMARHDQIMGQTFLQAFQQLRGGGQITEAEGVKATTAYNRMATAQSEEEYIKAAREFQQYLRIGVDRLRLQLGQPTKYGTISSGPGGVGATIRPTQDVVGQIPGQTQKQNKTSTGVTWKVQ